jgi:hypothetical protein
MNQEMDHKEYFRNYYHKKNHIFYTCECGKSVKHLTKSKHINTKKHLKILEEKKGKSGSLGLIENEESLGINEIDELEQNKNNRIEEIKQYVKKIDDLLKKF